MTCALYRAATDEIERLRADPAALDRVFDPDDASAPRVRVVQPGGLLGLILRILPVTVTEVVPDSEESRPTPPSNSDRVLDIEKGWHGVHFLLTGTAFDGDEPACFLLRGGEELDDDGHVRALTVEQTRRFAEFLLALTRERLAERYDPRRMTDLEIYPETVWLRPAPADESPQAWLLDCFADVQRFVARAAEAREGLIVYVG